MSNKSLQLSELIEKVKNKDDGAFEELYERYFRLVYYLAYKQCRNEADSKDIVQETFVEVQRSIHTLQNPNAFKFWLNRIALSKCLNMFRKNKYSLIDEDQIYAKNHLIEEREYMLPEKDARKLSDKEVLAKLINTLPSGQQQVLVLFYLEQFSIHEVAALMKISEGTVKSRLSYARATLRKKIEQYEHLNDTKLNFHSLSEAISVAMLAEVATIHLPKSIALFAFLPKKWLASFQSVATTVVGKAAFITICLGGASIGSVYTIQAWNEQHAQASQKVPLQVQGNAETDVSFPKLEVLGKEVNTAKAAYFNLRFTACCEEEMKNLSEQQRMDIEKIYTTLKEVDSPYYQSLIDEGWMTSFEATDK